MGAGSRRAPRAAAHPMAPLALTLAGIGVPRARCRRFSRPLGAALALLAAAAPPARAEPAARGHAPASLAPAGAGPYRPAVLPRTTPPPPWRRRRRRIRGMRPRGTGLVDLSRWPPEPRSPRPVDPARFARAIALVCGGWMPPARPRRYATWILEESARRGVDPFLLAGLVYRQSRCLPRTDRPYGVGLAGIDPAMHAPFIRRRRYRYFVLAGGRFAPRELELSRYAFVRANLRRARPNLYFAAALLAMWKAQHPGIDGAFGSVPHRSHVSHFVWGDRVRGAGAEDRILEARRRLIAAYRDERPGPAGRFGDLVLHCPLDGAPRKATSVMGDDRDDGARRHQGLDIAATWGEPVRAVAAGRVTFAGADRPRGPAEVLDPEAAPKEPSSALGAGGLLVMVRHAGGLVSAYMHLARYRVMPGDRVAAGDVLGLVGRTGVRSSGAHLHFELRRAGRHVDPFPHLEGCLFPPMATYAGRRAAAEQRRLRRRRRRRTRRALAPPPRPAPARAR